MPSRGMASGQMSDHLKEMPPAAHLLGREIVSTDPHSGEVKLRFTASEQFANRHGTVQGGMLAAMLDSATGNAVMARLPLVAVTLVAAVDCVTVPAAFVEVRVTLPPVATLPPVPKG